MKHIEKQEQTHYLDISKSTGPRGSLNTSKLIKKPVQVKGKDGKTFTRMQWVKPYEAEPIETPTTKEEDVGKLPKKPKEDSKVINPFKEDTQKQPQLIVETTMKKKGEDTQQSFIDKVLKKMSREEKYDFIDKFKIEWEEHDHKSINHMRAMVALKEYMGSNPEKFGAGHLPIESKYEKTPDGTDIINDFYNKVKKDTSNLYKMMEEAGIGTGTDPRETGDETARTEHMRNVMAYKKYLKDNMETLDDPRWQLKTSTKIPKNKKKQSKAQKGGNTIEGILDNISEEEKFGYIRKLGISEEDLTTVDKTTRMKLLNKLKVKIILDPSILNTDPHEDKESVEETERKDSLDENELIKEKVNTFFNSILGPTKDMLLDEYGEEEILLNRKRNANPKIDHMYSMAALKKHFMENPDLLEEHKEDLEDDELSQLKITNKQMEKVLRNVAEIRGSFDVKIAEKDEDVNRTIEWEFLAENFCRIERDSYGNWVLNIEYYDDKEGELIEKTFDLLEIKDYVKGLTGRGVPKEKEIPLHEKSLETIQRELNKSVADNYTEEVGKVLIPWILDTWIKKAGRDSSVKTISTQGIMTADTLEQVLGKMGVNTIFGFIQFDEDWNKVMYNHLIEDTKTKNIQDYYVYNTPGVVDTYVLHESAKKWTPEERDIARAEIVDIMVHTPSVPEGDTRPQRYREHVKQAMSFIPFDILSDIGARDTKIMLRGVSTYVELDENGNRVEREYEFLGGHFNAGKNRIEISQRYFYENSVFAGTAMGNNPGVVDGFIMHPLGHILAHEMGHCIDNLFSQGNNSGKAYLDWSGEIGKKYVGEEYSKTNPVGVSYNQTVESSNPQKKIGIAKDSEGNELYMYHKGNWIDSYEGRIYNKPHSDKDTKVVEKTSDGSLIDKAYYSDTVSNKGIEHWSHSVARHAGARMAYKDAEYFGSFDDWVAETSGDLDKRGIYAFSDAADADLMASYGKEYLAMKQNFPHMHEALGKIFDRGDFVGEKAPSYTQQLNESHPHDKTIIRKSKENLVILIGG